MMNKQNKAYLFGLSAVLCWSTVAVAFKLSLDYLSPAQLVFIATLASWLFFIGILTIQGRLTALYKQPLRRYLQSAGLGLINPLLYYMVLLSAYQLLPAQQAQAINYTWAPMMALLSIPLLGHILRRQDIIAVILCYLGVLVIATNGDITELHFDNPTGITLALFSTLLWALYWILNTRIQSDPLISLCLNFSFAIPFSIIVFLISGELQTLRFTWQGITGGIYIGIFEMGLSFFLWLNAMKYTDSTAKIANLIFISPILSLVFIYFILGEAILASTIIALILIIAGLLYQQR